jgi:hypothetical protein
MSIRPPALRPLVRRLLAGAFAAVTLLGAPLSAGAADTLDPISQQALDNYWRGDFGALEQQYLALRRDQPLTESGVSKLELFRIGLARVNGAAAKQTEPYLRELEALTLQWANEHPRSALAHVLHAEVLAKHGWSYRGSGYVNTVTPQAMEQFEAYLRRAVAYLEAHADVAMTDSSAHVLLLEIGRGLGWDRKQLDAISQAGLKLAPYDLELYFDMLTSLLPKWYGDGAARALDDYIRRVTERTKADYGTGMYARLYSAAAEQQFSNRLFEDSYADWPTMKRAYEDMHARYPNSPARRNHYAYMACLAKDRPTLLALLAELGPKLDASQWGQNGERTLEVCQRWAQET